MNREQKKSEVESLKANFVKAQLAILADYKGLKANEFNSLRQKMRAGNASTKVVKNRLAKLALKGTSLEVLEAQFKGTTVLALADTDPVSPAKVLVDFAKENEKLIFKAAAMNGKIISKAEVEALAKLPSREEMIAKLIGSMLAPARNWVSVLAQIPRQLVNVLAAVRDQKEKQG